MENNKPRKAFPPSLKIVVGFMAIILIGTLLLMLPISSNTHSWLPFIDSLFTSTSAVCVTGLIVVDTATYFSLFGQIVIICLIQIGGLGIVAITSFIYLLLGKKIDFNSRLALKESLNKDNIQGVVKFIKKVLIITLSIELIGAGLLLFSTLKIADSVGDAIFKAIFISISAFCNAGFDILGSAGAEFTSLYSMSGQIMFLLPIMFLIVIGGIGFVVLIGGIKDLKMKQHSKLVLGTTAVLILGGAILFLIFEWNNSATLGDMNLIDKICNSLFQSITPRTAGFATLDQAALTEGSRILTMLLMFIGGSPNSTAGGIKTTTFIIIILFLLKPTNEQGDINFKNRRISNKIIMKAFKILTSAILALFVAITLITIAEGGLIDLESIIFECISAISTVGLSMNVTPLLSPFSRVIIALLMFVGRVGLTTIALALVTRNKNNSSIQYSNTDVIVG